MTSDFRLGVVGRELVSPIKKIFLPSEPSFDLNSWRALKDTSSLSDLGGQYQQITMQFLACLGSTSIPTISSVFHLASRYRIDDFPLPVALKCLLRETTFKFPISNLS